MNHRQLGYFLEVYKLKSITLAAEKLMISTQGISKTIVGLEKELGVQLFKRTHSGLIPTQAAHDLFPHAYKIVSEFSIIEKSDILKKQKLTVYSVDGIFSYFTMDVLKSFHKSYPDVELKIIETTHQSAIDNLYSGNGELAILPSSYDHVGFESCFLFSCPFCMVINNQNPLSQKKIIEDADWDGQKIAGRGFEYLVFSNKIRTLNSQGIYPIVCMESNNERLLISMAESNLALACVSVQAAKNNISENTSICILEAQNTYDQIHLIYQNNFPLSNAANSFKKHLISYTQKNDFWRT